MYAYYNKIYLSRNSDKAAEEYVANAEEVTTLQQEQDEQINNIQNSVENIQDQSKELEKIFNR